MTKRFQDKIALVIGGNSGIGLAAAKQLAAEGAHVLITGRDPKTLEAAETETPGLRAFRADVADTSSLDPLIAEIRETHGRIDALFVNAGVCTFLPIRQATPEIWDSIHDVNLKGCFFAVQKALPLMGKGSSIVFTGSNASVLGVPGGVIYASSKAGMRAMARILATELVGEGIRVNVISPGPTETPIINRSGLDEEGVKGLRIQLNAVVPMKRLGEPDEIARAMLFLASDEASFITGIDLFVDGGCTEL